MMPSATSTPAHTPAAKSAYSRHQSRQLATATRVARCAATAPMTSHNEDAGGNGQEVPLATAVPRDAGQQRRRERAEREGEHGRALQREPLACCVAGGHVRGQQQGARSRRERHERPEPPDAVPVGQRSIRYRCRARPQEWSANQRPTPGCCTR